MKDMCNNELKVGDLVIYAQKSARSRSADGTMNFGIISKFYTDYYGEPECSVTQASGAIDTHIQEPRIMKVETIATQYNKIKETQDFQGFLNAVNVRFKRFGN